MAVHVGLTLLTRRLRRFWTPVISGSDAVLIGGGQIFSDADLNFPMKIAAAADCCKATSRPLGIVAAGVSDNWSRRGRKLFARVFACDLRYIGLRDADSINAWTAQTADKSPPQPVLAYDPGLLAAACYGLEQVSASKEAPIGLGISDPLILRHHANRPIAGLGTDMAPPVLRDYFVKIAQTLVERGHKVRLFCNGAAEDANFLEQVARDERLAFAHESGKIECVAPPGNGKALAEIIAPCKGVIAHRLHACILAHACRRPAVGLSWDSKLDSFFALIDAPEQISDRLDPAHPWDLIEQSLAKGISEQEHTILLGKCTRNIERAIEACSPTATTASGYHHE
jgi:polysaccharide pyruvyl transferase WcaK-like protein